MRARTVRENVHTLWAKCTPQFLCQMTLDFDETWYELQVGIKDAPNKNWEQYVHAHARNARKRARKFL